MNLNYFIKHLLITLVVACVVVVTINYFWYPAPFIELSGGWELALLIIGVDLAIGPLLTLIVSQSSKSKKLLLIDLMVIGVLQITALIIGLDTAYNARPIAIAFEGDRFRVVSANDLVDYEEFKNSIWNQRQRFFGKPYFISVDLYSGDNELFLESVKLSMNGIHPSYQVSRWREFNNLEVKDAIIHIEKFPKRNKKDYYAFKKFVDGLSVSEVNIGYLPVSSFLTDDWTVLLDVRDGSVLGYYNILAW